MLCSVFNHTCPSKEELAREDEKLWHDAYQMKIICFCLCFYCHCSLLFIITFLVFTFSLLSFTYTSFKNVFLQTVLSKMHFVYCISHLQLLENKWKHFKNNSFQELHSGNLRYTPLFMHKDVLTVYTPFPTCVERTVVKLTVTKELWKEKKIDRQKERRKERMKEHNIK